MCYHALVQPGAILNSALTTLFLTGAVGLVGASRRMNSGSMNDDDDVMLPARSRGALPATRTRAQLALPNQELARRVVALGEAGDVLGGMSFGQAVNEDPRRAEGLIYQAIGRGFQRMGFPPGSQAMYAQGLDLARNAAGGPLKVRALLDLHASNIVNTTLGPMSMLPDRAKRSLLGSISELDQAFDEAAEIANRAQLAAEDPEDRLDWRQYVEFLRAQPAAFRRALQGGLTDRAAGRRRIG